jgi:hypothetical protein
MEKKRMPELEATGRRYRDDTQRARLASPGIERFRREGRGGSGVLLALAIVIALAAVGWWLLSGG